MGCWAIKLQCLQGFSSPVQKKKKKCLFLVVKLKYLSLLMLLSEASWAAESHTQRLLWIAIECPHKAEPPWPPGPGPSCLVCVREEPGAGGGRRWHRWDKSFLTEGRSLPSLQNPAKCCWFWENGFLNSWPWKVNEGETGGICFCFYDCQWGWWRQYLWYLSANHFIRFSFLKQNCGHTAVHYWPRNVPVTGSLGVSPLKWRATHACLSGRTMNNHSAGSFPRPKWTWVLCVRKE